MSPEQITNIEQALLQIALDLTRSQPKQQLFKRLVEAVCRVFPCDAVSLLQLRDDTLVPVAIHGLAPELIGKPFPVREHPRLEMIVSSRQAVRFADSAELPDPFDGLLAVDIEREMDVHACMGCSLFIDDQLMGAITLDALDPQAFDEVSDLAVETFAAMAAATMRNINLVQALEHAAEQQQAVARELVREAQQKEGQLIGSSEPMQQLQEDIQTVAGSDFSVLVRGETGTGKELVARTIHANSRRNDKPLVHINCAALPESIVESELFGHVKGAFTGATADRMGKFELADGGTLFLDEVGELPLSIQPKLLRALQQGEIQRVGADRTIHVDVRVVAATNRILKDEVAKGNFRADLYHRLRVFPVIVPSLREHKADLPELCGYFLEQNRHKLAAEQINLHPDAMLALQHHDWPGNIRELEHLLVKASLKAARNGNQRILIQPEHLSLDIPAASTSSTETQPKSVIPTSVQTEIAITTGLRDATEQFQRSYISRALQQCDGVIAKAARMLNTDRGNLFRLMQRLGIK